MGSIFFFYLNEQIQYAKANMDSAKEKLGETVEAAQNKISSTWSEIKAENPDLPNVSTRQQEIPCQGFNLSLRMSTFDCQTIATMGVFSP